MGLLFGKCGAQELWEQREAEVDSAEVQRYRRSRENCSEPGRSWKVSQVQGTVCFRKQEQHVQRQRGLRKHSWLGEPRHFHIGMEHGRLDS
jgi:hypothetical protein